MILLKDFGEPLLSFELIYFRSSFCYTIENSRGFRYKILDHVLPLWKNLNFLSPLGSLKFYDFLSFLFILKLSYSKPFHNTLNYASTANIEEAMRLYNLDDKTFETDFSKNKCVSVLSSRNFYAPMNFDKAYGCFKIVHFSKKSGRLSSARSEIQAFVSR